MRSLCRTSANRLVASERAAHDDPAVPHVSDSHVRSPVVLMSCGNCTLFSPSTKGEKEQSVERMKGAPHERD